MLIRTKSGIANEHLFYGVDFIVYLEGGPSSYDKEQIESGQFSDGTLDILFWERIFTGFLPDKSLKLKSVGSKSVVLEIAREVINNDISSVLIGMDNEFDEIFGKRIVHSNVFYTYGYSWENDVWHHLVVKNIIEELSAIPVANNDIENNFTELERKIRVAVLADGMLFETGADSFFCRKSSPLFCVDCSPRDLPYIKEDALEERLIIKAIRQEDLDHFEESYAVETLKLCYGHFLADYCCQLIMHYLKNRLSLKGVTKDILFRMVINKYFQNHFRGSAEYSHYQSQFDRIVA